MRIIAFLCVRVCVYIYIYIYINMVPPFSEAPV